jgi:electron transport complex protein RnfD
MFVVIAALLPGLAVMALIWGVGVLVNLVLLATMCCLVEAVCLQARGEPRVWFHLRDGAALVTAALIAACLPPGVSWFVLLTAALAAVGVAKHAYGGLGHNVFNPAMVGYAVALLCDPAALSHWPNPDYPDALSGATQLTQFRFRDGLTVAEFTARFGESLTDQELVAAAYLVGGAVLLYLRIAAWRVVMAMFLAAGVASLLGYDGGSSVSHGSVWFHWTSGGFVMAALFVATDPVTHPRLPSMQLMYGAMIGVLVYLIRVFGAYPDGIAFAVLLANCATPLLNRFGLRGQQREPAHG